MKKISAIILVLFISACSIYKSEGRKSFETKAPTQAVNLAINAGTTTISQKCRNISEVALDIEANFSRVHRELLSARDGYEIWKTELNDGQIQITEISQLENDFSVCESVFNSESDWQKAKSEYFVNNSAID